MNLNLLEEKKNLATEGFCKLPNVIDESLIYDVEDAICKLIISAIKKLPNQLQKQFEDIERKELPHKGLIKLYKIDPKLEQLVVDALPVSSPVFQLLTNLKLLDAVCQVTGVAPSEMTFNEIGFRLDLPSSGNKITQLFELPSHQESSYFKSNM